MRWELVGRVQLVRLLLGWCGSCLSGLLGYEERFRSSEERA